MLHDSEHPKDVDVIEIDYPRHIQLLDWTYRSFDAYAIDASVQAAQIRNHTIDQCLNLGFDRQIGRFGQNLTLVRLDISHR